jgi:hypothetical protein
MAVETVQHCNTRPPSFGYIRTSLDLGCWGHMIKITEPCECKVDKSYFINRATSLS